MKTSLGKRSTQAALFLLLLGLGPAFFTYITIAEHGRRVHVLTEGRQIDAQVIRSYERGRRNLCVVEYSFELNGANFVGDVVNCPLMQQHSADSRLPVRVDPADPDGSLAVGDTVWPGYAIAPILLWPPWLLVAGVVFFNLFRDTRSGRAKRARAAS